MVEQIIVLLVGLIFGAGVVSLAVKLFRSKGGILQADYDSLVVKNNELVNKLSLLEDRIKRVEAERDEKDRVIREMTSDKESLIAAVSAKESKISSLVEVVNKLEVDLGVINKDKDRLNSEIQGLIRDKIRFDEENKHLKDKLDKQKAEIDSIGDKFSNEFKLLANQILDEKSKRFTELNEERLSMILKPLGENIAEFKRKVEETYDKESKQRFSLEEKIKDLVQLNVKISEEANNLTKALKADTKTQGNWGEVILESILQRSGLVKDREYFVQQTINVNEDGKLNRVRPDVIIVYPDNKKIIIDSKVSLVAYERYINSSGQEEQNRSLSEHLRSLRSHIDNLSSKNYQDHVETLDFVMMFVPIEPAYLLGMQNDTELWNYAYQKRILLISPTNLIAALKLIVDLWKRELQNKNVLEIAERGGALYDKLHGFVEDLQKIGIGIDKLKENYDVAFKKLKDGRGNLLSTAQKLKELGSKAKKSLPEDLFESED